MKEIGGKPRGSEDPLHVFDEEAVPLGLVYILSVKSPSQEWTWGFCSSLAILSNSYLEGKREIVFGALWHFIFFTIAVTLNFFEV